MARILCVDDELLELRLRKQVLESAGYLVSAAHSAEEALQLFQNEPFDIVIVDYWMPGLKGTGIARRIKQLRPNVPVIVLSGLVQLPGEIVGVADYWIMKGDGPERLLEVINNVLSEREPLDKTEASPEA